MKTRKILFYLEVNHRSFAEYAGNHIHTLMDITDFISVESHVDNEVQHH